MIRPTAGDQAVASLGVAQTPDEAAQLLGLDAIDARTLCRAMQRFSGDPTSPPARMRVSRATMSAARRDPLSITAADRVAQLGDMEPVTIGTIEVLPSDRVIALTYRSPAPPGATESPDQVRWEVRELLIPPPATASPLVIDLWSGPVVRAVFRPV